MLLKSMFCIQVCVLNPVCSQQSPMNYTAESSSDFDAGAGGGGEKLLIIINDYYYFYLHWLNRPFS